ncbi:periplasmic heavy metal sensor [Roseateles sp.]|uniref:Spy/CpxP family protein refolding chaperone n=1 Tax=Roseateles sp. TaxID=1971397 RepID=UPI0025CE0CE3|nr:periplasmic heavy metal sensor [Roseateles sp.]MBV8036537.1 periplasmic heavy metal sensor [Roseateles sp.]
MKQGIAHSVGHAAAAAREVARCATLLLMLAAVTLAGPAQAQEHCAYRDDGVGSLRRMLSGPALDSISPTLEQRTHIRAILADASDDAHAYWAQTQELNAQMARLMLAPKVNAVAVEALRQQQLGLHAMASKRRTQHMMDLMATLTPEQRVRLAVLHPDPTCTAATVTLAR